ncbi:MAG: hypothetical protein LWX07_01955 [Bacteroidetes bacterium]|nr:hypothetical protein [Bacteroidota bacterium]
MNKKNVSPKKPSDAGRTGEPESRIDRRNFLGIVAKAAIPTIAFLSLGNLTNLKAGQKKDKTAFKGEETENPNDCMLSCEGGCRTTCEGECRGTCQGLCFLTCEGSCKYTCEGGCNTTCDGCRGTCQGGCSGQAW